NREHLANIAYLVRHQGRLGLHETRDDLAVRVEGVEGVDHVVLRVPKIDPSLAPEDGNLQPTQEGKHVPLWPQRVPQANDIGPELMEAGDAFAARSLDDGLFEMVEQRLKPIEM